MGKERINIIGRRFGRLVVLSHSHNVGYSKYFLCRCDCGTEKTVAKGNLLSGKIVSCGCKRKEDMNAIAERNKLPEHYMQLGRIFHGMKARCYDTSSIRYNRYGGRGIRICEEWLNDINTFRKWAIDNGYQPGLSIDRIDNDGNYCPENCRWIQPREQLNNFSKNVYIEFNGRSQTLTQWARELGIPKSTLHNRIRVHGWNIERALTEPRKTTNH